MIYIYILSILFTSCIKIYDDLIDYYKLNHGNTIIEFIKIIITFTLTLLLAYSNNVYIYISLFFAFGFSIFSIEAYFSDEYFKFITIIFGIILLFLIKVFFRQFNIKHFLIFSILSNIQAYPLLLQEKIIIPFQDKIPFLKKIQKKINKLQIEDAEVSYTKLKIRLSAVIVGIIQLFFINKYISNYFKLSYNSYNGIVISNLAFISYYLTSVIHQTYVLYNNIP